MKIVEHTEVGKYYMAYWATDVVRVMVTFKQAKETLHGGYARLNEEHLVINKLNRWTNDCWIEVHPDPYENPYTSLSFYSHLGERDAIIYELNDDEIKNHIVMEII
jgi:hypothetical protein